MNRLQFASSPYLLQHARNPVDWYPWSSEALERAQAEHKPIFLSVGYSACHWCHVMEHESFEDAHIAEILNEHFVCIKVDREERPDLDQIYMLAVQVMTGHGGWPMSLFLTPDRQPFFGGTYWPRQSRMGMPGFEQVLLAVIDAWQHRRSLAQEQAATLTARLAQLARREAGDGPLRLALLDDAALKLEGHFDATHGGFGSAPKFPHAIDLQLLLRIWQRTQRAELRRVVDVTLDAMAQGGIYDHLGGGFARYSVDARWLVPHFEKMLYDNALLAATYTDSYLATGNPFHRQVACETLDYVLRDMTDASGGFHAAEDADSEGEEGKYYVWSQAEIQRLLGTEQAERFGLVYGVTEYGNFEGHNILHLPRPVDRVAAAMNWPLDDLNSQLSTARHELLQARGTRVRPGRDDKVIVAWNGMMLDSLSRASRAFDAPHYRDAAVRAAEFLWDHLWREDRLLHCWRRGAATLPAYLDDYATLANGLISLYEATFDTRWLDWAIVLLEQVRTRFADPEGGALFYTADDHEQLVVRAKDLQDGSVPSGNAMAATAAARLAYLTSNDRWREFAAHLLSALVGNMEQAPLGAGQALIALDWYAGPVHQVAIVADRPSEDLTTIARCFGARYLPRAVFAQQAMSAPPGDSNPVAALFEQRSASDDQPTVYVCQGTSCDPPYVGVARAEVAARSLQ